MEMYKETITSVTKLCVHVTDKPDAKSLLTGVVLQHLPKMDNCPACNQLLPQLIFAALDAIELSKMNV